MNTAGEQIGAGDDYSGGSGLSKELANAIIFIASDQASFITDHVRNVDGGKSR
jgi:NAD(P)-dependent dehydrogenase (short-subunit alcohol dehydrogenase family)